MLPGAGLFGHQGAARDNVLEFLARTGREGGDICRVRFLGLDMVFINSPAYVQEVLVDKAKSFEKSTVLTTSLTPFVGRGLFTSRGALWKQQHKLIAPLFHPSQIAHYGPFMFDAAARVSTGWSDGATVDMEDAMTRVAMAAIGKALFDADTFDEADELCAALTTAMRVSAVRQSSPAVAGQALLVDQLERVAPKLPGRLGALAGQVADKLFAPVALPTEGSRQVRAAVEVIDRSLGRMIGERRRAPDGRRDLLSQLLGARDADTRDAMSDRQVRDEAVTLFVAGHETTATALTWCLYFLAQNPAMMQRVQAEADALGERPLEAADGARLPYTLQVFKETLRIIPSIPAFGRQALAEVTVGPYTLPEGQVVFVSPYAMHRRPALWPDAERFDPDRFTPAAEAARPRHAYIPFSTGPRVCVGSNFALLEGQLVLATLARRFAWTLATPGPVRPDAKASMKPERPLIMRVRRR